MLGAAFPVPSPYICPRDLRSFATAVRTLYVLPLHVNLYVGFGTGMMSVMSCDVDAVMKKTNKPNVVVRDSCVFIFLSALMDKF